MHFEASVTLEHVERSIARPGFAEPFHRVHFILTCDGIPQLSTSVWVHPAYPEDDLESVARAFLAGRLRDLAAAAQAGGYTPEEVESLWTQLGPPTVATV